MADQRLWRRLDGVRRRTTLAATLVVAIALAAAAVSFVSLQRHQLEASLTAVAKQQASDVSTRVATEGSSVDLSGGRGEQALVQVVAADGSVVASSEAVSGEPPVVDLTPEPGQTIIRRVDDLPIGESESFVVVARGSSGADGEYVVIAAQSLESVERSTAVVAGLLATGYPLLLVIVASTSYWLTGRALAPVETMRRRVAGITATDLAARVPVPRGGDEIAQLAATMNAMIGRLEAASTAQRRFVADASHELRSPLATIRAAHEIAEAHPHTTDWSSTSQDVLAELERLDRLVADMLLLARSDESGLALRTEDVDLDDIVRAEAERLRKTSALEVVALTPPVRITGDRHHLSRAVRNLIDNAARHATSQVEIRLSADDSIAVIEVIDDGPGIDATDVDRVFERFIRLDQSRTRSSGGAGLGLPIARHIARAHHGDLVVVDHSAGARLLLTLPRNQTRSDNS